MSFDPATIGLDVNYVRTMGEEVRARLFPRPKQVHNQYGELVDGPTPYPLPVVLRYTPTEDLTLEVIFILTRTMQTIGAEPPAVDEGAALVVWNEGFFTTDLTLGQHPEFAAGFNASPVESRALSALLDAVAGVL